MDDTNVDLSDDAVLRDPFPSYDRLRAGGPVRWDDVQEAWLVTGYPQGRQLAKDTRLSAKADMSPFVAGLPEHRAGVAKQLKDHYESWMLFSDGERHSRLRSLAAAALGAEAVEPLREPLRARARQLLGGLGAQFDVVDDYATPLSRLNLAQVFGVPEELLADGARWAYELVEFINIDLDEQQAVRTARVIDEMADFLDELCQLRPAAGTAGEVIVRGLRTGDLDRFDATGLVGQLVSGVMGAQPYLVGNAAIAIWRSGSTVDRADARLVEEALRFDPPFLLVPRTATADIPLGEVTIRAGDRLGILLGAVNRDPTSFGCPHAFDAAQRRKPHMSFGTGAHYCLGSSLVRVFAEVALGELLAGHAPATTTLQARPHAPYFGLRAPRGVRLTTRG